MDQSYKHKNQHKITIIRFSLVVDRNNRYTDRNALHV